MRQKGFTPIVILLGVFIVLILIIYLGFQNGILSIGQLNPTPTPVQNTSSPLPSSITNNTNPTSSPLPIYKEKISYSLRLFDPSAKFFEQESYPLEIINLSDNQLQKLYCSSLYEQHKDYIASDSEGNILGKLDKGDLYSFLESKNKELEFGISNATYCMAENGTKYIHYEIHGGGGGSRNKAYFGILNSGQISNEVVVPVQGDQPPYFWCPKPLALTTDNIFYWSCGGGDGGYGSSSIYTLNFNTKTSSLLKRCESHIDTESKETYKSIVTCN